MTAYEQRSYPGAAADTLLNADLAAGGTSFSVTPGTGTGYPDGSQGPFFVIIDWDTSKAEKVRCSGRVNDTFTIAGTGGGRGQDGTSAQLHTANAKIRAVITATDIQEANRAAANTVGKVTTKGDTLAGTGANTLARVAAGADGTLLVADSTQTAGVKWSNTGVALDGTSSVGGVTGNALATDRAAWTGYTPVWTGSGGNPAIGNGNIGGAYRQVGKTVNYRIVINIASLTTFGSGTYRFGLPVAPIAAGVSGVATLTGAAGSQEFTLSYDGVSNGGQAAPFAVSGTTVFASGNVLLAAGQSIYIGGTYEAA